MIEVLATLQESAQKSRYHSSELLKFQHEMHILGFFTRFEHKFFFSKKKSCMQSRHVLILELAITCIHMLLMLFHYGFVMKQ